MRVGIVGHTGNLGSALVRRLARRGDVELTGIARRLPRAEGAWARVDAHGIDVAGADAERRLTAALAPVDTVVHLAWALQPNHDLPGITATNIGGLGAVLRASVAAGVQHIVVASSVGAYSPGPKKRAVDESWPTGGIATSHYARHKASGERMLDRFEQAHPEMIVTRLRPGLVMQRDAASEIARLFLGAVAPAGWAATGILPFVPLPDRLRAQVVHADDVAAAVEAMLERRAGGAFNLATDDPIGPEELAAALGAPRLRVPTGVLRAALAASWRLRLQASDPGWLDLATTVPLMSSARARELLDWNPTVSGETALAELLDGLRNRAGDQRSPSLRVSGERP